MNVLIKTEILAKFTLSIRLYRALYLLLSAVYLPQSTFALTDVK